MIAHTPRREPADAAAAAQAPYQRGHTPQQQQQQQGTVPQSRTQHTPHQYKQQQYQQQQQQPPHQQQYQQQQYQQYDGSSNGRPLSPGMPPSLSKAAAHLRSDNNGGGEEQRVQATATGIINGLDFALAPAAVTARLEQLRLLLVKARSIFPIWAGFEQLTQFCAAYHTADPLALTSSLQLLRTVLDTAREQGGTSSGSQQLAKNEVNVPTPPSIFVACLRLLPMAVLTTEHQDQACRHVARATVQALLTFTRDAPSAILHRLGILTAQPGGDAATRGASARCLFEILCTGRYWPKNMCPPVFDESEFYAAIRSLVTCLADDDARVAGAAEDVLASLRDAYDRFQICVQNLPLECRDALRLHASAIDRKGQQQQKQQQQQPQQVAAASDGGGASLHAGDGGGGRRAGGAMVFGCISAHSASQAVDPGAPVAARVAALQALSQGIDGNLAKRHECLMCVDRAGRDAGCGG
jgi:hypothetical protein